MEVIDKRFPLLDRLYFDGACLIVCNGEICKTSNLFSFKDVELISIDVDLQDVRNHRINFRARSLQAAR